MEPILKELDNRFVLFPIKYNGIWKMYKKAVSAFWTPEEIDLSKDYDDWIKLNENEQTFVKNVLAFFAGSDGIVNENLSVRFMNEVACQEAKCFYGFQIAMENIHCVAASTMIMTDQGYYPISSLQGKQVTVWNGYEWSDVTVVKTHSEAPVMEVKLSNGITIQCTPNHEWLIDGAKLNTFDLKPGMKLDQFQYPICDIEERDIFTNPYDHGYTAGNKRVPYSPAKHNCRFREFVPINYSFETRIKWIQGFLTNSTELYNHFFIENDDVSFKTNVQLLFSTFNVFTFFDDSGIYIPKNVCSRHNPLCEIIGEGDNTINKQIIVRSVADLDKRLPMYCFEESKRHTGIFNGILTGQSEVYSLLLDTYIKDGDEKRKMLDAINTIPCIKKKADWALKWIVDKDSTFAKRIVAFACVEGIFFSGAFCSIFWLKERGILPGLTLSNEFISRDESLHTEFAILLYSYLQEKLSKEEIYEIISEAVTIEDEFINDSIPCMMLGMNRDLMSQYIKFVADRLVIQLGYDPIYNVNNPFSFMDRISLNSKTNFFEHTRQSEYAIARVGNNVQDNTFDLTADF